MAYRRTDQIIAKLGENRRGILNAAHALVAEGGFAAAQMTEVARRADVATGTLYRYFPSKEDLCRQVYREVAAREIRLLNGVVSGEGSATERLRTALRLLATRAARGRQMAHALLTEAVDPALEAERATFKQSQADAFTALLREGVERGELKSCNAQIVAACLIGAITSALVGPLADDNAIEDALHFCHQAIGIPDR